jgi:hypothetical protein
MNHGGRNPLIQTFLSSCSSLVDTAGCSYLVHSGIINFGALKHPYCIQMRHEAIS